MLDTQGVDPTASSVRPRFCFVDGTALFDGVALLVGRLYLCVTEVGRL